MSQRFLAMFGIVVSGLVMERPVSAQATRQSETHKRIKTKSDSGACLGRHAERDRGGHEALSLRLES
jgi:hypothetical protein